MRNPPFYLLLVLIGLTSCVGVKRHRAAVAAEENRSALIGDTLREVRSRLDSVGDLLIASRGGNELLLIAHRQLQDRLLEATSEREALRGNLNNTQSSLNRKVAALEAEIRALEALDTGRKADYQKAIRDFSGNLDRIKDTLERDSLFRSATLKVRYGVLSVHLPDELLFRPNSVRLLSEADPYLQAIVDLLQADPTLDLTIVGHTDNQSDRRRGDNWSFSAERAVAVAKMLSENYFVSPNRLSAEGKGEYAPLQSNATATGRKANRRVEFQLSNSVSGLIRSLERVGN